MQLDGNRGNSRSFLQTRNGRLNDEIERVGHFKFDSTNPVVLVFIRSRARLGVFSASVDVK